MISEFITVGSFEDPFNEFFIEKFSNLNPDKVNSEDQIIYKLTSEGDKIPVFLID